MRGWSDMFQREAAVNLFCKTAWYLIYSLINFYGTSERQVSFYYLLYSHNKQLFPNQHPTSLSFSLSINIAWHFNKKNRKWMFLYFKSSRKPYKKYHQPINELCSSLLSKGIFVEVPVIELLLKKQ